LSDGTDRSRKPPRGLGRPETSVRNYHHSLCDGLEERSSNLLRGGSLKSHILSVVSAIFKIGLPDVSEVLLTLVMTFSLE